MNAYAKQTYSHQYQNNQILTASQEQILLLLYDGAIRFCRQAIAASDAGNTAEKIGRIEKTYAIIDEFSKSLNHEIGGDIAVDLENLYEFMLSELNRARRDTSSTKLKVVETLLIDLRDTWGQAVEINKKEQGVVAKQLERDQETSIPVQRFSIAG